MKLAIYVCDQHVALITKLNDGVSISPEHMLNPTYFIWSDDAPGQFMERWAMLTSHTLEETHTLIYPVKSK